MRTGTTLDLHVHTAVGSLDSTLQPDALLSALNSEGLNGALIAEHMVPWPERLAEEHRGRGQLLISGVELAFGPDHLLVLASSAVSAQFARNLRQAPSPLEAAKAARDEPGAIVVLAHPFRYHRERWGGPDPVRSAADRELIDNIDAVEVVNGGCTDEENQLAFQLACLRGLPMTAGSDAHEGRAVGYAVTRLMHTAAAAADVIEMVISGQSEIHVRRRGRRTQWDGIGVPRTECA